MSRNPEEITYTLNVAQIDVLMNLIGTTCLLLDAIEDATDPNADPDVDFTTIVARELHEADLALEDFFNEFESDEHFREMSMASLEFLYDDPEPVAPSAVEDGDETASVDAPVHPR